MLLTITCVVPRHIGELALLLPVQRVSRSNLYLEIVYSYYIFHNLLQSPR
jgi:hypothetical protein